MEDLYTYTAFKSSEIVTKSYSTSFSLGIRTLHKRYHDPIYAIYGFVRYADEIVDTFHNKDKADLLKRFEEDTFTAIREEISLNPILHSFQVVVNQYNIDHKLIRAFLISMEMDLEKRDYTHTDYVKYIYGSAEVVGLMCLKVFVDGDAQKYDELLPSAKSLGSAFQKVNFLRDIKSDFDDRGRVYFPNVDFLHFTEKDKREIEQDISIDFKHALSGIKKLPEGVRGGVYLAYVYYTVLFKKIAKLSPDRIKKERIRVPDVRKMLLWIRCSFSNSINYIH